MAATCPKKTLRRKHELLYLAKVHPRLPKMNSPGGTSISTFIASGRAHDLILRDERQRSSCSDSLRAGARIREET